MKRKVYILLLVLSVSLFSTCEKFEVNPATKVETSEVSPSAISVLVTGNIIELSGEQNDDYGFCYSTTNNPTINDSYVSVGSPKLGNFSATIESLDPNTQLFIRAYCKDKGGYTYGNVISISTKNGDASFSVPAITGRGASWAVSASQIISDGGAPINARGVCWGTSSNPTVDGSKTTDGSGEGDFISSLTGLLPNTTYYVRPYATNIAGTSYGEGTSFKTLEANTMIDGEGNLYRTITVGGKEWMAENLKVTKYNDGTAIAKPEDNEQWAANSSGAYTIYPHSYISDIDSDEQMVAAYGIHYNWYAVDNPKGLCPVGWRIPTDTDWTDLTNQITGSTDLIGNKLKSRRQINSPLGGNYATTEHPRWEENSTYWGTDDYGFSALPSSYRFSSGTWLNIGFTGRWWTSTSLGDSNAWFREITYDYGQITRTVDAKNYGLSVRCIRD
jgi:uncharacterized protein (TIGR02145 family)